MKIRIENLTFETIIGILEHERITPQRIQIDCVIDYPYSEGNFINYADVVEEMKRLMIAECFELIETALESLAIALKTNFPSISALTLTIRKPDILPDAQVGVEYYCTF